MQPTFPKILSSQIAFDIARAMLDGFDKHYRLFREASQNAKRYFEQCRWQEAQAAARERISFYDKRVQECVTQLEDEYRREDLTDDVWHETKLHYIGLLIDHKQPELAETFFNSVFCRVLHRSYFNNEFIFVRPAVSTDYIESEEIAPVYRVYYPARDGLRYTLKRIVTNFQLDCSFVDLERDIAQVEQAIRHHFGDELPEPNHQIQVLASLFYRNKGAYLVGKFINGNRDTPFVMPIVHSANEGLVIDAVLFDPIVISVLFSFTRAYFMADMEVPSAYVRFLQRMMPSKPLSELYTLLGLHKQGKTLFYRDYLHHLRYSSDQIEAAPGIRGLVMVVFAMPSFPYVFKVIKDHFPLPKETTRALVKEKYLLVKLHDRVGRMADTLEYSDVAFPRSRFSESLLAELKEVAPSLVEENGEEIVIHHLYIERRMTPLNIWLANAEKSGDEAAIERALIEYGNAIKELVAANIFPGDMLYKNFGVTRHGRVVFYDYDEIELLTDCCFRTIPEPHNEEQEMAAEPWYPVAKNDVFPEQFGVFLLGNPSVKKFFLKHHTDLLEAGYWRACQQRIVDGYFDDVFPYPQESRFCHLSTPLV